MGMSSYVVGFVPPDETWLRMKAAWEACEAAKIPVPDAVMKFFNYERPDPAGVRVELKTTKGSDGDCSEYFEVDVKSLPAHVQTIRFINSY